MKLDSEIQRNLLMQIIAGCPITGTKNECKQTIHDLDLLEQSIATASIEELPDIELNQAIPFAII